MDKIVKQVSEKLVEHFQNDNTKKHIECNVLDPIIRYIGNRLYPYIIGASIIVLILLILLTYFIFISVRLQKLRLQNLM